MTQSEMDLTTRKPNVLDEDKQAVIGYLMRNPCWPSAAQIASLLWPGLSVENGKRRVRSVAEASNGAILSRPGIAGYKLARYVSVEEYARDIRPKYAGQIRQMTKRLKDMDARIHGRERAI